MGEHQGTEQRVQRRARRKPLASEGAESPKSWKNEGWPRGKGELLGRVSTE